MTAEEFLTEQGFTPEKIDNEVLYKLIIKLMDGYAFKKQIEAIDQFRELANKTFNTFKQVQTNTIIMP